MNSIVRCIFAAVFFMVLASCGGGDTSVDNVEVTAGNVPSSFVGVYRGNIDAKARTLLLSESIDEPITITVNADNTITFSGDDPDEVFTTKIGSNGGFNGQLNINEGSCSGDLSISGSVNGSTASGQVGGEGKCSGVSVDISGTFNASK